MFVYYPDPCHTSADLLLLDNNGENTHKIQVGATAKME